MRFLVIGGAGFIGSHLVDKIISEGHALSVLGKFCRERMANFVTPRPSGRTNIMAGSILDNDALQYAMKGVDIVFHLAVGCVRKSLGEPLSDHAVNATETLFALEAARLMRSQTICLLFLRCMGIDRATQGTRVTLE
jgi:UDP-glucose 4-epimerase